MEESAAVIQEIKAKMEIINLKELAKELLAEIAIKFEVLENTIESM